MHRQLCSIFLFSLATTLASQGAMAERRVNFFGGCDYYSDAGVRLEARRATKALSSHNAQEQLAALNTLSAMGEKLKALRQTAKSYEPRHAKSERLRDHLAYARSECLQEAQEFAKPLQESVRHIAPLTASQDSMVRRAAARTIASIGYIEDDTAAAIAKRAQQGSLSERMSTLYVLRELGPLARDAEQPLTQIITSQEDTLLRHEAIRTLPLVAPKSDAVAVLLHKLTTSDLHIAEKRPERDIAYHALSQLADTNERARSLLRRIDKN